MDKWESWSILHIDNFHGIYIFLETKLMPRYSSWEKDNWFPLLKYVHILVNFSYNILILNWIKFKIQSQFDWFSSLNSMYTFTCYYSRYLMIWRSKMSMKFNLLLLVKENILSRVPVIVLFQSFYVSIIKFIFIKLIKRNFLIITSLMVLRTILDLNDIECHHLLIQSWKHPSK